MAQAAKIQPQAWTDGPSDLVRRLIARRQACPLPVPAPEPKAPDEIRDDAAPSPEQAAILVLKAALRAERAEVDALQTRLATLDHGLRQAS